MIEDYSIHFHAGRACTVGTEIVKGKVKRKYQYRTYYQTEKYGEMEPEKWRKEIRKEIHLAGEDELLEEIKDHCREWYGWLKTEQEIGDYAMDCLAKRAYMHWKDFQKEIIWM